MPYQSVTGSSRTEQLNYQYVQTATPQVSTTTASSVGLSITIVETGFYQILSTSEATIPAGLTNSSFETSLYRNGVLIPNSERLAGVNILGLLGTIGGSFSMSNMAVVQLNTNDVITLRIRTVSGSNPTINARNLMTLRVGL